MNCNDVRVLAPELALGTASAEERAAALVHLERCLSCREEVEQLAETVDVVSSLAPAAEPPEGFEGRVLARVDALTATPVRTPRPSTRARRRLGLVAAAAAVALALVGVAALRFGASSSPELASYTMQTSTGRAVGEAYLHGGDTPWLFVEVPGWTDRAAGAPRTYSVRVSTKDGHDTVVPGDFDGGAGGWGTVIHVDPSKVREVALVDDAGRVWCAATMS